MCSSPKTGEEGRTIVWNKIETGIITPISGWDRTGLLWLKILSMKKNRNHTDHQLNRETEMQTGTSPQRQKPLRARSSYTDLLLKILDRMKSCTDQAAVKHSTLLYQCASYVKVLFQWKPADTLYCNVHLNYRYSYINKNENNVFVFKSTKILDFKSSGASPFTQNTDPSCCTFLFNLCHFIPLCY